ncbi:Pentatricopeptide repeat domain-containing protein 3, mitochondrial [Bagarius yarrelli]|uniref:Small ribosomal subunit protein mS39 n=1 Tax=Bagarius yarrelli TaxID=175774 RepID=A0A556V3Z3_BAGYA|nr:Pentatricopeptide repeat domain-containing protein 3, mitochondrial [Bagarius yarrelli]
MATGAMEVMSDIQSPIGTDGEIVIPLKKTWGKEAVLQALAATVNKDPTACHYMFQDDSYLIPRTTLEFKQYSLSQESGRNAAKYLINSYPRYFQKEFAEPHIPCLMPEAVEQIQEVSEEALVERIRLRKVKAAVDMYDQLVQAGTSLSLDLTNDLLDLICLYGDQDPLQDIPEKRNEDVAEERDDPKQRKGRPQRASGLLRIEWRESNNAHRIFNVMPERNSRSYGALIRGMVKHGAPAKAFDMYTELLNNRMTADVHTFNALIIATGEVKENYGERWDLIVVLLKQMAQQKVKPNLLTFNAVLRVLRRGRFFNLLCMMENIDVVLKWYRELIPSYYYLNSQGLIDLLQAFDTDNRLDLIPQIWKDSKRMGHDNKMDLLEKILSLMAREKQSAETDNGKTPLQWSTNSLSSITSILLAAERIQAAGEMLTIYKATNRIPSEKLMNEFYTCIKAHNDAQQAVDLVQMSASFCLPITLQLIEKVQQEFKLTNEQKRLLSDLESSTDE